MDPRTVEEAVERMQALAPANKPALPEMPADWADEEDPEVRGPWAITDRGTLDWAMKRLAVLTAEKKSIEAQKRAAIERVEKRAASLVSAIQRGIGFFEYRIAEYAKAKKPELLGGGRKKSASLLHGTVGWRHHEGRLRVKEGPEAKAALTTWLERHLPLARVKVEPDMEAIQTWYAEPLAEGEVREIPPGMEEAPSEDVFYVKPTAPELEE